MTVDKITCDKLVCALISDFFFILSKMPRKRWKIVKKNRTSNVLIYLDLMVSLLEFSRSIKKYIYNKYTYKLILLLSTSY